MQSLKLRLTGTFHTIKGRGVRIAVGAKMRMRSSADSLAMHIMKYISHQYNPPKVAVNNEIVELV